MVLGSLLVIFGFFSIIVSFVPTVSSEIWLNESFSVPAFDYYYYYCEYPFFPSGINLHMVFNVPTSSDNHFSFFVMDEDNFQKMELYQPFASYYQRDRILSINTDITPPANEKIYFVWDNTLGLIDKTVSANFTMDSVSTLIPSGLVFFSFIFIFSGFALLGYGKKPVDEVPVTFKTKIGYALAVMGGFLGFFIGIGLYSSKDSNEKYHGKIIVSIGLIATIVYIVIAKIQGFY